jgi:hypothetical protein
MELNTSTVDVMQQMKDRRNKAKADEKGKGRAVEDADPYPASQEAGNVSASRKSRKAARRQARLFGDTSQAGTPDSVRAIVAFKSAPAHRSYSGRYLRCTSIYELNLTK